MDAATSRIRTDKHGTKVKFLGTHMPLEVVEALEAQAIRECRSASAQILYYIKRGLEQDKRE